jgi:hypothetical protein
MLECDLPQLLSWFWRQLPGMAAAIESFESMPGAETTHDLQ